MSKKEHTVLPFLSDTIDTGRKMGGIGHFFLISILMHALVILVVISIHAPPPRPISRPVKEQNINKKVVNKGEQAAKVFQSAPQADEAGLLELFQRNRELDNQAERMQEALVPQALPRYDRQIISQNNRPEAQIKDVLAPLRTPAGLARAVSVPGSSLPAKSADQSHHFKVFYDAGRRLEKTEFNRGVAAGSTSGWYRNGKQKFKGSYKSGRPSGNWSGWYENGQLKFSSKARKGRSHGISKLYYRTGEIQAKIKYKNGQLHGKALWWYSDGSKRLESSYRKDMHQGVWQEWFPGGATKTRGSYRRGLRHGTWRSWDPNGELYSLVRYNRGKMTLEDQMLKKRAQSIARARMDIRFPGDFSEGGTYPLILILHREEANISSAISNWMRQPFHYPVILAFIQSSQVTPQWNHFSWDNEWRAGFDISTMLSEAIEKHTDLIDRERIFIAGFSQGATAAIRHALTSEFPLNRFIAISPNQIELIDETVSIKHPERSGFLVFPENNQSELDKMKPLMNLLRMSGVNFSIQSSASQSLFPFDLVHILGSILSESDNKPLPGDL